MVLTHSRELVFMNNLDRPTRMEFSAFQSFVRENAEWFRGVHAESLASLERAEAELDCTLPASLRWLLTEWGYSGACGISSLSETVSVTLRCRGTLGLPKPYVVLNDWGDAGVVYLDTRSGTVTWTDTHGLQRLVDRLTPEDADTFPDYPAWAASRLNVEKTEV
ncbi:MAG TPA: hypothetical protein DDZ88_26625 [Verrucomicrobiales bacterium]|nr:hypothetical protein [Verrucomicrobiales bacterium]